MIMLALLLSFTYVSDTYFGYWYVARVIHTSGIQALSEEEATSLIGRKVRYSVEVAESGSERLLHPVYDEQILTADEFLASSRIGLFELGIAASSVKMVQVSDHSGRIWHGKFGLFFVKDPDTLVALVDGVYLELKRLKRKS